VADRRVVVTGMGILSPAGNDPATVWQRLQQPGTAATPVAAWPEEHPVGYACQVVDFDPQQRFGFKEARRIDRAGQLGLAAAQDAVAQAFGDGGPRGAGCDPARIAVVAGTGMGGLNTLEEQHQVFLERGASRVSPLTVPMMMANATAGLIGIEVGAHGPAFCVATACAAGANAIGDGFRLVRDGVSDVVVAGGTESVLTPLASAAFWRMGALSTNDDPSAASRPFDASRDGFVMGEGAAFLVLEEEGAARARGATILGTLLGYGRTCDANHITAPSEDGAGAVACMEQALADAGLSPSDVGHVNAHGTSTPLNDAAESAAITKVFGPGAVPVTSTKGVTGHTVGAAGAVEAVISLLAIEHGQVPPTANTTELSEGIEADVVLGSVRAVAPAPVVSNSFGFGGHNATLVLGGA
jgi:3-oxoacyl-[acyl-carrier-protein] synthase II